MTSVLKVDTIQNSTGTDALSIDSNGTVSTKNGPIGMTLITKQTIPSGVASFDLTNVFSSDYTFYHCVMHYADTDDQLELNFIKTSDSTVDTSSNYSYVVNGLDSGNAVRGVRGYNTSQALICNAGNSGNWSSLEFSICSPYEENPTTGQGGSSTPRSSSSIFMAHHSAFNVNTLISYNGFRISTGTGTFSGGTIAVFGMA